MQVFNHYSRYYDLLYQDKDYKSEAEFVSYWLNRQGVASGTILELGCGTGRHALEFARLGYNLHGVDQSITMIEQACKRISPELKEHISFDEADIRTAKIGKEFDAVISLFHVASYQTANDDIRGMFKTAELHLRSGGIFLFDCWYGPAVLTERPAVRVKRLSDDAIEITRIAEPLIYPNDNVVDINFTIHIVDRVTRKEEEVREKHSMRYFFGPELSMLLKLTGFELVAMFEWMSGKDLDFTTWSATIIAKKP